MERLHRDGTYATSNKVVDNFDREPLWFDDKLLYEFTKNCSAPVIGLIPGFRWWEVDDRRRMDKGDNITGDVQRAWSFYWAVRYGVQRGGIVLELGSTDILGPATLGVDKHCGETPHVGRYGGTYGYPHMRVDANEPLPFFDDKFEAVTSNHVMEHLNSHEAVLRECLRVVKPGGIVGHILPCTSWNERGMLDPTHVSEVSSDEFLDKVLALQADSSVPPFDIICHNMIDTAFSFDTVLRKR